MFTILHRATEVICSRGCDDLPIGSGTLPPDGEETEATMGVGTQLELFPRGGVRDDEAALL